jgi:hypothetical protein
MSEIEQQHPGDNQVGSAPDECAGATSKPEYKVGYKRPPRHTQFKPGQSGNPRGRPKGLRNHRTTLNRVMNEKVSIREGDKTRRLNKFEATVQAHALKSMKGDSRSAAILFNLMGRSGLLGDQDEAIRVDEARAAAKQVRQGEALFEHIDPNVLSKDELIELSRLAEIVDQGGGITALSTSDFERLKQIIDKGRGKQSAAA